jgi:toxin ParE1/3/4
MAEIRWTSEAELWLHDIHDYITADNPSAAIKVVEGIHNKVQTLRQFPEIGHIHRIEAEGEIRILLYGHYRIAYLRRKEKDVLDILGVFHGALDIDRYLEVV